jgi:uncharacterized membrane protein YeaQ/YmgE (transglycosylase-associated protein family)
LCRRSSTWKDATLKERAVFHLIWMLVTGFVVGLLARAVMPGADHMGVLATSVLGIGGSFVGGGLARLLNRPEPGSAFHPAGMLGSIIGAVVLLYLGHLR